MNPNLITAAIIVATLSIPTIAFLSIWISRLRKQGTVKDVEIGALSNTKVEYRCRLLSYQNLLAVNNLTEPETVCRILEQLTTEPAPGKFYDFDQQDTDKVTTALSNIYQFLFVKEFNAFTEANYVTALQRVVSFKTDFLQQDYISKDNPEFWPKLMLFVKSALDATSSYDSHLELHTLISGWAPLHEWPGDWEPSFLAKAYELSKGEMALMRQQLTQKTGQGPLDDKGFSAVAGLMMKSEDIFKRKLIKAADLAEMKQVSEATFIAALTKLREWSPGPERAEVYLEVSRMFERIYPKVKKEQQGLVTAS